MEDGTVSIKNDDCEVDSTRMKGLSTRSSNISASVSSASRLTYPRTGVLAKSAKKHADGDSSIAEASIAVAIHRSAWRRYGGRCGSAVVGVDGQAFSSERSTRIVSRDRKRVE